MPAGPNSDSQSEFLFRPRFSLRTSASTCHKNVRDAESIPNRVLDRFQMSQNRERAIAFRCHPLRPRRLTTIATGREPELHRHQLNTSTSYSMSIQRMGEKCQLFTDCLAGRSRLCATLFPEMKTDTTGCLNLGSLLVGDQCTGWIPILGSRADWRMSWKSVLAALW